jgi:polyvinyl alcohol dehydrogenase (cytochrome)
MSSLEEGIAADPKYPCCKFRGSVVALRIDDGTQVWKSYTIDGVPHSTGANKMGTPTFGSAGGAVWSAPTIDEKRRLIYLADGNSYTSPEAATTEAVLAFDLDTGKRKWATQLNHNDMWNGACMQGKDNTNCPGVEGPDHDFGASPVLATLLDGSDLLLAGQKSGMFYALDPDTGALLWKLSLGKGGIYGGIMFGFATDGRLAYVPISDRDVNTQAADGALNGVDLKTGQRVWRTPNPADACKDHQELCSTSQAAATTYIPGAVFSGSFDGHLRAYDPQTGSIVWDYDTDRTFDGVNKVSGHGGSISSAGPTIAHGYLYQNSGYSSYGLGMPGNVLLAFAPAGQKSANTQAAATKDPAAAAQK